MNKNVKIGIAAGSICFVAIAGLLWFLFGRDMSKEEVVETPNQEMQPNVSEIDYTRFAYKIFKKDEKGGKRRQEIVYFSDMKGNKEEVVKINHFTDPSSWSVARNNGRVAYMISGGGSQYVEIWSAGGGSKKTKLDTIEAKLGGLLVQGPIIDDNGEVVVYTNSGAEVGDKVGVEDIWAIDFNGENKRLVKTLKRDEEYGCGLTSQLFIPEYFSADSKEMYVRVSGYKSERTSTRHEICLLSLNLETGETEKLDAPAFADYVPVLSNDKKKMLIQATAREWFEGNYNGFGIIDLDSKKFEKIFQIDDSLELTASGGVIFSDDDRKIAYSVKVKDAEKYKLFVYDIESGTNQEVIESEKFILVDLYIGNEIIYREISENDKKEEISKVFKIHDDGSEKQSFDQIQLEEGEEVSFMNYLVK